MSQPRLRGIGRRPGLLFSIVSVGPAAAWAADCAASSPGKPSTPSAGPKPRLLVRDGFGHGCTPMALARANVPVVVGYAADDGQDTRTFEHGAGT